MEQFLGALPTLDRIGAATTLIIVAVLVITEKLIWHKRFEKVEKDRDKWQKIALDALTTGADAGVRAAETAVAIVANIPDPKTERESAGRD